MQSLYNICLELLADYAECVPDYSNVPFEPFIHNLITTIMNRPLRGKPRVEWERDGFKALNTIGQAHWTHIQEKSEWTGVSLGHPITFQKVSILKTISHSLPHFICHLNLSGCLDVTNETLYLLKPCIYLSTLDIRATKVTDLGVATLARLNLKHLHLLSLAENAITDASLKYTTEMATRGCLEGVDLSVTLIDAKVATAYLSVNGFERVKVETNHFDVARLIGWDEIHPGYVTIKTNRWLTRLLINKTDPGGHFGWIMDKPSKVLFFVKSRKDVSPPIPPPPPPAAAAAARRQRSEDEDEKSQKKRAKRKLNDYLSFVEQDLGWYDE